MSMPRRRRSAVVALATQAALIVGCGGADQSGTEPAAGQQAPSANGNVRLEQIGDFDQPVYVTQPPGSEDLYVVERQGTVRIVREDGTVSTPALDISDQVTSDADEQGFLSIAFSPDFQSSRLVYAYYTGSDHGDYCAGELRSFKPATPAARGDRSLGLDVPSLSSFGEDNQGHVYAVSLDGPVYRLVQ
jgi:glucose/arabinose dehydrogenase